MAEGGQLNFRLKFDKDTRALNAVEQELKKVATRGKQAAQSVGGIGGKLSGINNILGTFALGGFLVQTIRQAAGASDSMSDLNATFNETIGVIVRELEPAISVVTRGLQGLLVTVQGMIQAFKALIEGDFSEALTLMGDAVQRGAERVQGITRASEKDLTKIIIDETKIRLANAQLSGEQKLEIIAEQEARALEEIQKSGEFQVADEVRQQKLLLDVRKQFAIERESAEREALRQRQEAAAAEVEEAKLRIEEEGITLEERLARNENLLELELKQIREQGAQKVQSERTINRRVEAAMVRHSRRVAALQKRESDQTRADQAQRQRDRLMDLARHTGITEARLNTIADAGARELEESRNAANAARAMGAAAVRDIANQASRTITLKGVEAAAKVFAETPGLIFTRIAAAAGVGVFYAGLAATVSGLGGIAARAISPPSSGGGAVATPAPQGPLGGPLPVEFEEPRVRAPREEPASDEEEPIDFGAPPTAEPAGVKTIVQINAPFGQMDPNVLDQVVEAVAEASAD